MIVDMIIAAIVPLFRLRIPGLFHHRQRIPRLRHALQLWPLQRLFHILYFSFYFIL